MELAEPEAHLLRSSDISLENDIAAIHQQRDPCHIGSRIRAEPEDGLSRFEWGRLRAHGNRTEHVLPDLLISVPALVHFGQDRAKGDGIDPNVLRGIFEGCGFRQAYDSMFTGDVGASPAPWPP
jgi:hypothetical protein